MLMPSNMQYHYDPEPQPPQQSLAKAVLTKILLIVVSGLVGFAISWLEARFISIPHAITQVENVADQTLKTETEIAYENGRKAGYEAGLAFVSDPIRIDEAYQKGYEAGFAPGEEKGRADGRELGLAEGRAQGEAAGREKGYSDGWKPGWIAGYTKGAGRAPLPVDIPDAPAATGPAPTATNGSDPKSASSAAALFGGCSPLVNSDRWKIDIGTAKDSVGNTHSPDHFIVTHNGSEETGGFGNLSSGECSGEYNIGQVFSKLRGKVASHQDSKMPSWTGKEYEVDLIIYADGEEIFNRSFKRIDYPYDLDVDIPPHTKILKITEPNFGSLLLMDFMLYPCPPLTHKRRPRHWRDLRYTFYSSALLP
jgi:hypothetical protein